ncbi:multidrug effflux MFS transporter [Shewanella sp. 202IG2-18]|uniref:multidrug effflux MFS transporter n=1 Tax=Parashewanella hymeniacidonis TaxID=2807618 RepID=UPI0019607830|nr:multidrug effflux MFS transporter [Parashewanella hymeniacidonis]MBM7071504.1 multidrug effflux MFS transporter [Parashewanella hymeniacidonis]
MTKNSLILFLVLMATLSPFATDIFIPALPIIAKSMSTSVDEMHWTITIYLFSLGVGQLFLGPLADRIGRRPVILTGLLIYLCCSTALFLITHFESHLVFRFFQGLGSCALGVCTFACIRDSFDPKESSHIFNYLVSIRCLSPAFAPTLGHFLSVHFGWHSTFAFLAILCGLTLFFAYFFLQETRPSNTIKYSQILPLKQYVNIAKSPIFLFNAIVLTLSMAMIFSYISSSPVWLMQHLGLSQETFTFWFSLNGAINIFTNLFLPKILLKRIKPKRLVSVGMVMMILAGVILAVLSKHESPISYMLPVIIGTTGFAILVGVCFAQALHPYPEKAGTASALLSFCQVAIGAVLVMILHLLNLNAISQLLVITSAFIPMVLFFHYSKVKVFE